MRAKDLSESSDENKVAALFEGEVEAEDIGQGNLGDCWLLASLASIAELHPRLIREACNRPYVPLWILQAEAIRYHQRYATLESHNDR